MKKNLRTSELNDAYGLLLTERQREIIKSYYDFDLSLAEISENYGITRQAVRDAIVKGEQQLEAYEASLRVLEKREKALIFVALIKSCLNEEEYLKASEILGELESIIQE